MKYKNYFYLLVLLLIAAINFNLFLKPLKLVTGGTQGLAIILNNITKLEPHLLILIINIITLILSYFLLSKKTTFGTILATISYPLFVKLTSNFAFNFNILILNIIITGLISGFTNAYIYKLDFTAGGINTIGPIVHKYINLKIGTINFIINTLIMISGCFIFGIKNFIYALIVILLNSLVVNLITSKKTKEVVNISRL